MIAFQIALKTIGGAIILIALTHVALGPNADVLLGSKISLSSLTDPTIDSQNRFYGAAFALYGVILIICSSDLDKYRSILVWTILIFFAAGLARLVSVSIVGWPPTIVVLLLFIEVFIPPLLIWWFWKLGRKNDSTEL